jgi:hypothetical protein
MGVHNFPKNPAPRDDGGEPPYDEGMEVRVKALEQFAIETRDRLTRIEVKLDAVAAKAADLPSKDFVGHEISKSSNKIILWVAGISGAAQLIPSLVVPLLKHFGI